MVFKSDKPLTRQQKLLIILISDEIDLLPSLKEDDCYEAVRNHASVSGVIFRVSGTKSLGVSLQPAIFGIQSYNIVYISEAAINRPKDVCDSQLALIKIVVLALYVTYNAVLAHSQRSINQRILVL